VAGVVAGAIVVTHPFAREKLAGTSSFVTPRHRTATQSPPSPSAAPPSSQQPLPAATAPVTPAISTQDAAMHLAALLAQSMSDRQLVSTAYNDVSQCGPSLPQDARTFRAAAASHHRLLSGLATMPGVSALPQAMVRDLSAAWQASATADEDLARWAQDQVANGCSPANQSDPNYLAAGVPNRQATMSKRAFVRLWNPLARTYGLKTYSQRDL
jgi:hypothetical protein